MKYDVEMNGMVVNEEDRETAADAAAKILQVYGEKLRKLKEEESDG